MANLLKQLELEELSLVDRPANAEAMVSLFKRDNTEVPMTDEVEKMSDDMKAKLKPYMDKGMTEEEAMKAYQMDMRKSEIETIKAENERLRKALIENGFVIKAEAIEKKAEIETIEVNGEAINKADIPAAILKALEETEIQKREIELKKRCEEVLPHVSEDAAKVLLKSADALEDNQKFMEFLRSVDALFGQTMQEVGKQDVDADMSDPETKMDNLVKEYLAENKMSKADYAKAYASIAKTDMGKSLIKQIYEN